MQTGDAIMCARILFSAEYRKHQGNLPFMKNVVKILAQLGFEDNVSQKDASHCVASHFLVCQMLLSYSGMQRPSLSITWKKHVALKPLKSVPV